MFVKHCLHTSGQANEALHEYRALAGVRIPRLIPLLSTSTITAMSFEDGKKVTQVQVLSAEVRVRFHGQSTRPQAVS
jgi:hypothetical protein